ncbi:glycosyltransferase family 4 protein [Pectinatus frisingensis]|uniref:glycosyltransferase family 4 protein n=1 Tax=Pectinatus frisingensis TaxID=865 RepID=UPI0018C46FC3|nr:glycosyltransferase family 4 protein [Pectinatus frisingensis]
MNIGIVSTWFERGAAYVSKQYMDILKKQHNVFVYARGGENEFNDHSWERDSSVTVAKKVNISIPTIIDLKDFKKWLLKYNIQIILFNEQHWWLPVLMCNHMNIITGAYVDYYTEETVPFFNAYDFLICNTKRHYSVFKEHMQSFFVPWGTNISLFTPNNIRNEKIVFFHSAGCSPERKGTGMVIEAFSKLNNKEESRLVIHSQVDICSNNKKIEKIINDNIRYIDIIKRTVTAPGLYFMGDVYVYPTVLEGIGLTIPEALSSGLPVITTNCSPMKEFITKKTGKLVKVSKYISRADGYYWPKAIVDVNNLRENMQWYVDHKENISTLKQEARRFAVKNLNWMDREKLLLNIFNQIKISSNNKIGVEKKILSFEKARMGKLMLVGVKHPFIYDSCRKIYHVFLRLGL